MGRAKARLDAKMGWRRGGIAACVLASMALAAWWISPPPDLARFTHGAPTRWSKLERERRENPGTTPQRVPYVPLSAIPIDLQLAALAGEDIGFLTHGPLDVEAIRQALDDWWAGGRLRGASTITQQVAKNLFLSENRTLWRKLCEARDAAWLESKLGKRRVLELYLNIIELGEGTFGVEAAARRYFGVSVSALTTEQAAALAAAIPSPLKHNPQTRTRAWASRQRAILQRMAHYPWMRSRLAALAFTRGHRAPTAAKRSEAVTTASSQ